MFVESHEELMNIFGLVEEDEINHFCWFWIAWEDLFGLDECLDPEVAYEY